MPDAAPTMFDDPEPDGPLLFGRVLDGEGGARALSWAEAKSWQAASEREVMWVHLCRNAIETRGWLDQALRLSEPTVDLLTSDSTRPRALREGDSLVAVLRGINFNPGAEPEDMVSMQLWCDGCRLVTLRRRPLQSPRTVLAAVDSGSGPRDCGRIITELVEALIERMSRSIADMNDAIDEMEQTEPDAVDQAMLQAISTIRRDGLRLQRHMAPQHEALEIIAREAPAWFDAEDRREMAESIDSMRRYLEDIDIFKESAVVLQDEIRSRSAARVEKTNYLLTLVAAIFLPLTFLTGLLGINVGGIPGASEREAFWIVLGLCAAILVAQLLLFRRWKWL